MKGKNQTKIKRKIGALGVLGRFIVLLMAHPVAADLDDWSYGGDDLDAEGVQELGTTTTHDLPIITDGTQRMRITSGGNIGIGTDTTPDATLEIINSGTTPFMVSNGVDGDGDYMLMDTNGRLGIGDTSPDFKLEVTGSSGSGYFGVTSSSDGDIFIIDSNGDVGIGVTNPAEKLEINGDILFNTGRNSKVYVERPSSNSDGYDLTVQAGKAYELGGMGGYDGGDLYLKGGDGDGALFGDGGNVYIYGGDDASGNEGNVILAYEVDGSSSRGNVGIGTVNPSHKLEISDSSDAANRKGLYVTQTGAMIGTGYGSYITKTGGSTTNVAGYFSASGATNNYGLIVENGDIGIGTTGPNHKVEIIDSDNTANRKGLYVTQTAAISGTGYGCYVTKTGASTTNVAGYFSASEATNNYGLIVENGDVGIGETNPQSELVVSGTNDVGVLIQNGDTGSTSDAGLRIGINSLEESAIRNYENTDMRFGTNANDRVIIKNDGKVGIGTTNPSATLEVSGDTIISDSLNVHSGTLYVDDVDDEVGIGTTTPSSKLDVSGNTRILGDLNVQLGTLYVDSTNYKVGIGTSSPEEMFEIYWASGVDAQIGRGDTDTDITYIRLRSPNGNDWYLYPDNNGDLQIDANEP
ncbi:MAG: hypothetical protein JSV09_05795 [Thermoplasmata archaeon]|nr:MAG: hypothetical protein JSV09_05795 [Thermoplasmata archaeon]